MRRWLVLAPLLPLAAVAQLALLPGWLPPVLRPDLGLLIGLAGLVFLPAEAALALLFALGVQADLLGGGRFGLLTLGYLSAAALMLSLQQELVRAGSLGAWLGAAAGTLVAHGAYVLLSPVCGAGVGASQALAALGGLLISAALFGVPVAWGCGRLWSLAGVLSPQACAVRASRRRRQA
jgi:hypothetical protein